jgi:hypothetical protein
MFRPVGAYVAHVGGFVFGCMTARLFEREGRAVAKYSEREE